MRLKVLGSSSSGNCYILEAKDEILILECGVKFSEVKKAIDFNINKVAGCLITHEHGDHSKYVNDVLDACIDVWLSEGTMHNLKLKSSRLPLLLESKCIQTIGSFRIMPLDVKHDCAEPFCFVLDHPESGIILFATDTYYLPYKFDNLSHVLIECNYSKNILDRNFQEGIVAPSVRNRIIESHMSLDTCKEALLANDLTQVKEIILIHLSDSNSNEEQFVKEIKSVTGKRVFAAKKGFEIELNKGLF